MPEERDCVVKLVDDHGVEHSVRVRAKSVYEAALKGLTRLEKVGRESDGTQVGSVLVEVWEEPTLHRVAHHSNARRFSRRISLPRGYKEAGEVTRQKLYPTGQATL